MSDAEYLGELLADWAEDSRRLAERRRCLIRIAWAAGERRVAVLADRLGVGRQTVYEDLRQLALPRPWLNAFPVLPPYGTTAQRWKALRSADPLLPLQHFRVVGIPAAFCAESSPFCEIPDADALELTHIPCQRTREVHEGATLGELLMEAAVHLANETCEPDPRAPHGRDEVFAVRRGEKLI